MQPKQTSKKKSKDHSKNPRKVKRQNEDQEIKKLASDCISLDLSAVPLRFTDLPISTNTLKGLQASKYETLTPIQALSLPRALKGKDVLGAARTGSGKTLAFLIPVLEILYRQKWGPTDALGALIISPTRELAVQIFEVLRSIGRFHLFSAGLVIGGKSLEDEQERLGRMNILVATPGRLLQHLEQTTGFDCDNLQILVLDEADRILDMGFAKSINAIISSLPRSRQSLLFSATQTKSVKDLARLSLQGEPEYVAAREAGVERDLSTPKELVQSYMVTPLECKLDFLWSFLKTHLKTKMIVFLSSCKQVRFVYEAFRHLRPGIPLLHLHGKQKQIKRLEIYEKFSGAPQMCLFATDIAARGLDFPAVDWVVQADCPEDVDTYVHRVGRTARYQSGGKALLFLLPSEEQGMVRRWQERGIVVASVKPNDTKRVSIQNQLQAQMFKFPDVKFLGQRAFISYVRSIHLQKNKDVFDLSKLDLAKFAESMGLPGAPQVRVTGAGGGGAGGGTGESAKAKKNAPRFVEALKKQLSVPELGPDASQDIKGGGEEEDSSDSESNSSSSEDDEERPDDGSSDCSETARPAVAGDESIPGPSLTVAGESGKPVIRTKYDRMFQRKNQDILSQHYAKIIDRGNSANEADANENEEDEFLTVKRVDHELDAEEAAIADSAYLSKRKLKQATSKKAIAMAGIGAGKKILFDEDGQAHDAYKILGEDEFKQSHNVKDEMKEFVLRESEKVKKADKLDRMVEKNKRLEKKRKRKAADYDDDVQMAATAELAPPETLDEGYVSPEFNWSSEESDQEGPTTYKKSRHHKHKDLPGSDQQEEDLEALAMKKLMERCG